MKQLAEVQVKLKALGRASVVVSDQIKSRRTCNVRCPPPLHAPARRSTQSGGITTARLLQVCLSSFEDGGMYENEQREPSFDGRSQPSRLRRDLIRTYAGQQASLVLSVRVREIYINSLVYNIIIDVKMPSFLGLSSFWGVLSRLGFLRPIDSISRIKTE